jgi:Lectin C-type domain
VNRPHLASVTSQEENDFLLTLSPSDLDSITVWIGLNNRNTAVGAYRWEGTDEPLAYDAWCTPEQCDPSTVGANDTCVAIIAGGVGSGFIPGSWYPESCSYVLVQGMVFEYDCPPRPA